MAHFLPRTKTLTSEETTRLLFQGVYRSHGLPRVLFGDRDPKFVGNFLHTLWRRLGMRLDMSSSGHPEKDGLRERVNNTFQKLLRCLSDMTDRKGQPCCLKWNLHTTPLVHSELSTHLSRRILAFLVRSLYTCCSACDFQSRFCKT
jgi:transposase InsO family protein